MLDEWRTRALVTEAKSLRPFFVPNRVMAMIAIAGVQALS
jgi:hypothetical protein